MVKITSKDNKIVKFLIKIRDNAKFRREENLFYVEGKRIVFDTPKELVDSIYVNEKNFDDYITDYINVVKDKNFDNIYILSENVFDKIRDTINSQGIIALVKNITHFTHTTIEKFEMENSKNTKLVLILDNIQDPGNLGTIIRMAEASGVDLVILTNDCCDIYNTKSIRASMSSIFRQKFYVSNDIMSDIDFLKNNNYKIFTTSLNGESVNYTEKIYDGKVAIVVGNEGNGVRNNIISKSDKLLKIPMLGKIESLNVAIATSIICYEYMRQMNEN